MNNCDFQGIIPPLVTPFDDKEELNEEILRREVRFVLSAGVHGISLGGSTGEGPLLSDKELARGIQIVQEENNERVPVLCGVIRNSTRQAVSAGLAAKASGADALMVTPTYYFGASTEGNYEYFQTIAEKVGLPIIIYNVISTNPITPSAMARITEIELVIGIKQSVGGIHGLTDMIAECGSKTLVFGAQDDLLYISYLLGAVGSISAILTLFPRLCVEQWDAVRAGNIDLARDIHYRILPVFRRIEGKAFPGRLKATMSLIGRDVGSARSPIMKPSSAEMLEIGTTLANSGFLYESPKTGEYLQDAYTRGNAETHSDPAGHAIQEQW